MQTNTSKPLRRGAKPKKVKKIESTEEAVKDKLVTSNKHGNSTKYYENKKFLDQFGGFDSISNYTKRKRKDLEEMKSQFPDILLAIEILIAAIISPNSLTGTPIVYQSDTFKLTSSTTSQILALIKDRAKLKYKLEENLYSYLFKAMAIDGAYSELIVSEAQLSNMVNDDKVDTTSLESAVSANDIIRTFKSPVPALNKVINKETSITSDMSILRLNKTYTDKLVDNDGDEISFEEDNLKDKLDKMFRVKKQGNTKINDEIPDTKRDAYGAPLRMVLPAESVIPIYFNNDIERPLRYVILLDEKGSPIRDSSFESANSNVLSLSRSIVDRAKEARVKADSTAPVHAGMNELSTSVIEKELAEYLLGKNMEDLADSASLNNIYTIMAQRALSDKQTKLLVVKPKNILYLALEYRVNGTGKTALEDLKQITSMRALLRISNVYAILKGSISNTEIEVTLDADDPDPYKSMESIKSYVSKTRELAMPTGILNHKDLSDWLHKAGYHFKFNHDSLPDITINYNTETNEPTIPDDEMTTKLEDTTYQKLGVNRNMIDDTKEADFAATIVTRNTLFARRVAVKQVEVNKHLTHYIKMMLWNDGVLLKDIKHVLENELAENKKLFSDGDVEYNDEEFNRYLLNEFINTVSVKLPPVKNHEEDGNKEAFVNYKSDLEEVIESFFSTDALPEDIVGKIGDKMDDLKNIIYNTKLREWMAKNNYMPDMLDIFKKDSNGEVASKTVNEHLQYFDDLSEGIEILLKETKTIKRGSDKTVDKFEEEGL